MTDDKREAPPEIKALLAKTKIAQIEGVSEVAMIVYVPDDLREFVKAALPRLRKGGTLTFDTPSKIPEFAKVQAWLDAEEVLHNDMRQIFHPDGERVLMSETLEVRYPNMPHARDSYVIRLFWKKFITGDGV
jgi:hypothetical protein